MSVTFTKLFASITESTVWCEPDRTRLVWVCMLAMADRHGRVWASIPGLASRARVPLADAEIAIQTFLAPDPYSRTKDHEGRRIEEIDGGWRLLNHEKYRSIRDEETIKESKRNYINNRRAAERAAVEDVEQSRPWSTHTEADTEADKKDIPAHTRAAKKAKPRTAIPKTFKPEGDGLQAAIDAGLNVDSEVRRFIDHHEAKGSLMASWPAAWRTWISNAVSFGRGAPAKPKTQESFV